MGNEASAGKLDQEVDISLAALGKDTYIRGKWCESIRKRILPPRKASNEADWDILTYGIKVTFENHDWTAGMNCVPV